MDRTFEQIAAPFQTGEISLPKGVGIEVGIIAHTSPEELEGTLRDFVGDTVLSELLAGPQPDEGQLFQSFEATHTLASSVDKTITRLGRRRHIANCIAGVLLGAALGVGAYKGVEPLVSKGIEAAAGTHQKEVKTERDSGPIAENSLGIASGIGGVTGGVFGYVIGSLRTTRNAHNRAQKIVGHTR